MINILIPVKAFKNSKNRLSNSLSNNQRITASKNLINSLSQNFIKLDQKVIIVTDDKDLKIKNTEIFFTESALNNGAATITEKSLNGLTLNVKNVYECFMKLL